MRLKTKFQNEDFELGEVVDAEVYHGGSHAIKVAIASHGGMHNFYYDSLDSMCNEWEDAPEEPKVGYIIDPMEEDCVSADDSGYEESDVERAKELGLWFKTEEEAKRAVEKLKAWKRLKDNGFRFNNWKSYEEMSGLCFPDRHIVNSYAAIFDFNKPCRKYEIEDKVKDALDLLFSEGKNEP